MDNKVTLNDQEQVRREKLDKYLPGMRPRARVCWRCR